MPITSSQEAFDGLTGAMFTLILRMDDVRSAMGERIGIGVTGLKTLSILKREGASTAGYLAVAASITSGSMTATIDKLVDNDLARRVPSEVDRRSVLIELTESGTETMDWIINYYYDALSAALPSAAETEAIARYLETTAAALGELAVRLPTLPR